MLYYILAHIPSKELEIQNRGIRVVERMSLNIKDRQNHYQKSIANFECQYLMNNLLRDTNNIGLGHTLFSEACMNDFPKSIQKKNKQILRDFNKLYNRLHKKNLGQDGSYPLSREKEGKIFERWVDSLQTHYNFKGDLDSMKSALAKSMTSIDPNSKIQLFDSSEVNDFLVYKLILNQGRLSEFLGLTAKDFMQEIKQYEFFEDIILVDHNSETVVDSSVLGIKYFAFADGKYLDVDVKDSQGNKIGKAPVDTTKKLNGVLGIFFLIMYKYYYLNLANSASLYFSIITAGALINYRILSLSQIENPDIEYLIYKYRISMFEVILAALTIMWTAAFFLIEESNHVLIAMPVLLLVTYVIRISYDWKKEKSKQNDEEFDFRYFRKLINWVQNSKEQEANKAHRNYSPFYLHGFTWIILVSLIPTLIFFKPIYNHHHLKRVRHDMQKEYFYRVTTQQWKSNKISSFPLHKEHSANDKIQENVATKNLIDFISFYLGNDAEKLKGLDKSKNLKIDIYKEKNKGVRYFSLYMNPYEKYYDKNNIEPATVVTFRAPILNNHDKRQAVFFWSIIIATLVLLYITIVQLSEKFFHLKLLENLKTVAPDKHTGDDIHESIKGLGSLQQAEKYFMLTGLPFSGKNTVLRKHLGDEAYNKAYHIDCLSSLEKFTEKIDEKELATNNVIINNFDHRIHDFEHNKLKLDLLEHILGIRTVKNRDKVLALVTNFDIYQIIEVYQQKIDNLKIKADPESKPDIESYSKTMNRWSSALIGFTKHVIPLTSEKLEDVADETEDKQEKRSKKKKEIEKVIDKELNFGEWLPTLKPHMKNYMEAFPDDESLSHADLEDNINNEIRSKSENYYFSIWNSCSKDEKFLLYDLAQDGLINAANVSTITSLTRKGIITIDPYLKLFNNSFGEFIINSISSDDYKLIEKQKKAGTWSSYRYFVIFLVIIIVIFLSYVEQAAFTEITGLVSLGAAMVPRFLSTINSIRPRKKTAV